MTHDKKLSCGRLCTGGRDVAGVNHLSPQYPNHGGRIHSPPNLDAPVRSIPSSWDFGARRDRHKEPGACVLISPRPRLRIKEWVRQHLTLA